MTEPYGCFEDGWYGYYGGQGNSTFIFDWAHFDDLRTQERTGWRLLGRHPIVPAGYARITDPFADVADLASALVDNRPPGEGEASVLGPTGELRVPGRGESRNEPFSSPN